MTDDELTTEAILVRQGETVRKVTYKCEGCWSAFHPTQPHARYCSKRCGNRVRQYNFRWRKRMMKAAIEPDYADSSNRLRQGRCYPRSRFDQFGENK
jgi:hypothetical protein